jgi:hypothetical protein
MNTTAATTASSLSLGAGRPPLVLREFGPTYRKNVDCPFVAEVSLQIVEAMKSCGDKPEVVLKAFLSPWDDEEDIPHGQLCIRVHGSEEKLFDITITFGLPGDDDEPYRTELEPMLPEFDVHGFAASDVIAGNFDECWLIVCEVLEAAPPASVSFSFGL